MIHYDRKLIFVHIPKCGGTSVEDCLWPPPNERTERMLWMGFVRPFFNKYQTGGLQHLTAGHIQEEVGEAIFSEFLKFAVCRHPQDRIVSQYKYMSDRPDLRRFIGLGDTFDFDEYLDRISLRAHVQWTPQADFVCDRDGRLLVDKVYKLEHISKDASQFFNDLGINLASLPRKNTTDSRSTPTLSAEQRDRIYEMYRGDYDLFAYDR